MRNPLWDDLLQGLDIPPIFDPEDRRAIPKTKHEVAAVVRVMLARRGQRFLNGKVVPEVSAEDQYADLTARVRAYQGGDRQQ